MGQTGNYKIENGGGAEMREHLFRAKPVDPMDVKGKSVCKECWNTRMGFLANYGTGGIKNEP